MQQFTIMTRIWIWVVVTVAVMVGSLVASWWPVGPGDWLTFTGLALAAIVAHSFPVMSAQNLASFRLTNAFLVAAAVVLPPGLAMLLPAVALAPDSWRRRRAGWSVRWIFNVAQTSLAAGAAGLWCHWLPTWLGAPHWLAGGGHLSLIGSMAGELVGLTGAALIFTLVQNLLVGMVIAFSSGQPLRRSDTLTPTALLGDSLIGLLGSVAAGVMMTRPSLLLLFMPIFLIAYQLMRSAHLAQLAQIDAKTGLLTIRRFEELLEEELNRGQRLGRPLALLFADFDHFKQINDQHGHDAGDAVLKETAVIFTTVLGHEATIGRFGGEEFVAFLPGVGLDEALYQAEQVRQTLAAHPFHLSSGMVLHGTISIGVATFPADAGNSAALITSADRAMYLAKRSRNAVGWAGLLSQCEPDHHASTGT